MWLDGKHTKYDESLLCVLNAAPELPAEGSILLNVRQGLKPDFAPEKDALISSILVSFRRQTQ